MANFYLDISEIGNAYQAYVDTPTTWGIPQDGNGKAGPGHSAAVAIATVDCASASASGAGAINILGVTVSSTLTGSGATLAGNIVTAINAASTAVSSTYSALLLPLNKLVFARQHPTTLTLVQIMMRIAGDDWNSILPVSGGTWATAPVMGAFSGGANGPFAYYANNGTVFGKTALTYGVRVAKPASVTDPSGAIDYIVGRCARAGSSLTQSVSLSTAGSTVSGQATNRTFIWDSNGATWPGDEGQFTLSITNTADAYGTIRLHTATSGGISNIARTSQGFRYLYSSPYASPAFYVGSLTDAIGVTDENCVMEEVNSTSISYYTTAAYGQKISLTNPVFKFKSAHACIIYPSNAGGGYIKVTNIDINYSGLTSDVNCLFDHSGTSWFSNALLLEFLGGRITTNGAYQVLNGVSSALTTLAAGASGTSVSFIGISGLKSPVFAAVTSTAYGPFSGLWEDPGVDRSFRYSCNLSRNTGAVYECDWLATATTPYPSLRSVTPSGKGMSVRVTWLNTITPSTPVKPYRFEYINRLADGVRTIQLDFLAETAISCTTNDVGYQISYIDTAGIKRDEYTFPNSSVALEGGTTPLSASTETWANKPSTYSAKKFVLTTAYPVMSNTPITCSFIERGTPSGNTSFFLDLTPLVT